MKKHFVPKGETNKHTASMTCLCKPKIDTYDGKTVAVHRSVTGLEQVYNAKVLLGMKPNKIQLVEITQD